MVLRFVVCICADWLSYLACFWHCLPISIAYNVGVCYYLPNIPQPPWMFDQLIYIYCKSMPLILTDFTSFSCWWLFDSQLGQSVAVHFAAVLHGVSRFFLCWWEFDVSATDMLLDQSHDYSAESCVVGVEPWRMPMAHSFLGNMPWICYIFNIWHILNFFWF